MMTEVCGRASFGRRLPSSPLLCMPFEVHRKEFVSREHTNRAHLADHAHVKVWNNTGGGDGGGRQPVMNRNLGVVRSLPDPIKESCESVYNIRNHLVPGRHLQPSPSWPEAVRVNFRSGHQHKVLPHIHTNPPSVRRKTPHCPRCVEPDLRSTEGCLNESPGCNWGHRFSTNPRGLRVDHLIHNANKTMYDSGAPRLCSELSPV